MAWGWEAASGLPEQPNLPIQVLRYLGPEGYSVTLGCLRVQLEPSQVFSGEEVVTGLGAQTYIPSSQQDGHCPQISVFSPYKVMVSKAGTRPEPPAPSMDLSM